MAMLPVAATAAAVAAMGMYIDAKCSVSSDLAQIANSRRLQSWTRHLYDVHGEHDWSFYHVVHTTHDLGETHGNRQAFVFEERSWTYNQFRQEIGRVAEALTRLGVKNRTVVGLFINNSPEFMFIWWALFKLGGIPAPINTGITGEPIRHCLRVCSAEFMVCSAELFEEVKSTFYEDAESGSDGDSHPSALPFLDRYSLPRMANLILYDHGTYPELHANISSLPRGMILLRHDELPPTTVEMGDWPPAKRPNVGPTMASQFTFTSGTTGLPKAVTWPSGYSLMSTCRGRWPHMYEMPRRFYICLPMFHGTAL